MKKWQLLDIIKLGGEGSGHHGHAGIPGQRGGSASRTLRAIPQHVWQRAGQRARYRHLRQFAKKLRTAEVFPRSKKVMWHIPVVIEGRLAGTLVGNDAVAKTFLGPGMVPKEGSREIIL